jgi:hypothetical protein
MTLFNSFNGLSVDQWLDFRPVRRTREAKTAVGNKWPVAYEETAP